MTTLKGKIEYLEQPQMSQETLNKLGAGALKFDSRMMNDPSMGYFAAEQKRIQDDYHKELARIGAGAALEIGATALIPAGMGIGAKVGTKLLKPVVGKAMSRAIGQGAFSGGLSGGLSGTGHGLMTNQNPVVSGVAGIAGGALGGGALGFGAGKIANTIRTNKINDLLSKRADWGIAYQKASGNPALAIETLLEKKQGFVPNAVNKRGIGNIDFIWGKHNISTGEGGGLEHIIARREKQGIDTTKFLNDLPDTLRNGVVTTSDKFPTRKYIEDLDNLLSFGTDFKGKNHNWLITSFKQNKSAEKRLIKEFPSKFRKEPKLWDVIHNQKEKAFDSLYDLIHRNKW